MCIYNIWLDYFLDSIVKMQLSCKGHCKEDTRCKRNKTIKYKKGGNYLCYNFD